MNQQRFTSERERYFVAVVTSHRGIVKPAAQRSRQRALDRAVRISRAIQALSQEELGFRSDLHRNYVGAIERGEINPTFRVLLKLARGLNVSLSQLVMEAERWAGSEPH
jgi:ribosome-binding protein aMBF1 (putative translation factor)